ncbi:MAG TPA: DNA primase [Cyclobacteriaceae bacterium]|nr:DNA primase [Cyclobacteriaceae bacterium]
MINKDTIDDIKNRIDIVDVISDFITLKKAGVNYKALSPFSNEKTASFFVVPGKGIFKDFSSGKGGDAITFVMEHEGMTYVEALKFMAKKYGVEIQEEKSSDQQLAMQSEREGLYVLMNFAKEYYKDKLINSEEGQSIGLTYFRERGFNDRDIQKFELGYALEGWENFSKEAAEKGYSKELLEKTGLVVKKDDGSSYDRFRGRVIFPVHNLSGKVIAFGARMLGKDKNQPKYVNSPETEIYHKSDVLYGLYQAKNIIRQKDNCYLVEGYTDVISMHKSDVQNVVASSGTALTISQVQLIRRFTENVTVLFDGDAAGIKAAIRGIDMLLESGLNVRVVLFPDGEDPDSYSRKVGTTEFQKFLHDNTKDFVTFKAGLLLSEAGHDPIKKAETIQDILRSVSLIPDYLKRTTYLQEVSKIFTISPQVLNTELNKILIKERRTKRDDAAKVTPAGEKPLTLADIHELSKSFLYDSTHELEELEREFCKVLINIGDKKESDNEFVYQYLFYETDDVNFISKDHIELLDLYKIEVAKGQAPTAETFMGVVPHHLQTYLATIVVPKYSVSEGWKKHKIFIGDEYQASSAHMVVARLKLGVIQMMIDEGLKQMQDAQNDKDRDDLLEVQFHVQNAKKDISFTLGRVIQRLSSSILAQG